MVSKIIILAVIACVSGSPLIDAIHHPQPYKFGYSVKDHHGEQHREESSNGAGAVVGNYGFTDDRGIARQVDYVADHAGFRAAVKTNEPGTANQSPAAVHMVSSEPYVHGSAVPYHKGVYGVAPVYGHHDLVHDGVYAVGHKGVYGVAPVYGHHDLAHDGVYDVGHKGVYVVAPVYGHHDLVHDGVYDVGHKGVYGVAPVYGHHDLVHDGVYNAAHKGVYGLAPVLGHQDLVHDGVYDLGHKGVYGHDAAYGLGYGALGYSGLLGGAYGGPMKYGGPLVGGAIKSFDSRYVNVPLVH